MIHIITVHWMDDRWIDIQLNYLQKFIKVPFRVYAFLNFVPEHHGSKFYYASFENIKDHATKLNILAKKVCEDDGIDSDWIIFMDGDAFPIADVVEKLKPILEKFPLTAVQRAENYGDKQPHPLFAVTTVGFWKKIEGDWRKGYSWRNANNSAVTDVGGNLLGILEKNAIDWHAILRSNKTDLHVLNFAIYGDLVYHHGASFRPNIARVDKALNPFKPNLILKFLGKFYLTRNITYYFRRKHEKSIANANKKLSDEVFEQIKSDTLFYKRFI